MHALHLISHVSVHTSARHRHTSNLCLHTRQIRCDLVILWCLSYSLLAQKSAFFFSFSFFFFSATTCTQLLHCRSIRTAQSNNNLLFEWIKTVSQLCVCVCVFMHVWLCVCMHVCMWSVLLWGMLFLFEFEGGCFFIFSSVIRKWNKSSDFQDILHKWTHMVHSSNIMIHINYVRISWSVKYVVTNPCSWDLSSCFHNEKILEIHPSYNCVSSKVWSSFDKYVQLNECFS